MYVEPKILTHFQASQIEGLVGSHQQKKWVIQKIGRKNLRPLMAFDRKTQLGTLQSGIMVSDLQITCFITLWIWKKGQISYVYLKMKTKIFIWDFCKVHDLYH